VKLQLALVKHIVDVDVNIYSVLRSTVTCNDENDIDNLLVCPSCDIKVICTNVKWVSLQQEVNIRTNSAKHLLHLMNSALL